MIGFRKMLRSDSFWLAIGSALNLLALAKLAIPRVPNVNPASFIDIRHDKENHDYSIIFSSRTAGLQGHAYVTLVAHPQDRPYEAKQIGFYSTGNPLQVQALFGGLGEVEAETTPPGSDEYEAKHSLVLWLDRGQLEAAASVIDHWRGGRHRYVLFQSDCIAMLHDVATASGLQAPRRLLVVPPDRYVQALIEVNVDAWVRTTAKLTGG